MPWGNSNRKFCDIHPLSKCNVIKNKSNGLSNKKSWKPNGKLILLINYKI